MTPSIGISEKLREAGAWMLTRAGFLHKADETDWRDEAQSSEAALRMASEHLSEAADEIDRLREALAAQTERAERAEDALSRARYPDTTGQ